MTRRWLHVVLIGSVLIGAVIGSTTVSVDAQDRRPAGRSTGRRIAPLRPKEVTDVTERSIKNGLAFLAKNQHSDGSWGKGSYESSDYQTYPTAMTSLAGLCFLASGSTPTRGPYARNIEKITKYLLSKCSATANHRVRGLIYNPAHQEERPMYCHAFSMTYLSIIFGHEKNKQRREEIRQVLKDAVELCQRSQTDWGGWGYWPNHYDDEGTLVVTFLQALRSCRDAGISVPKSMVDKAIEYIRKSANSNGSVRYRANPRSRQIRPGVTCASVVALWQAGDYDTELFQRISNYVNQYIARTRYIEIRRGHHAEYVLYYLAQSQRILGPERWQSFYSQAAPMLVGEQDADGSWEGKDRGDVYGTLIALLILQMPYERLSVFQR